MPLHLNVIRKNIQGEPNFVSIGVYDSYDRHGWGLSILFGLDYFYKGRYVTLHNGTRVYAYFDMSPKGIH